MGSNGTDLNADAQRNRRNALKMAIFGSAAFWGTRLGRAGAAPLPPPSPRPPVAAPPHPVPPNGKCLLRGAAVLTGKGERRVEDLAIGDLLPTVFGGLLPIQWIGRYPMKKSDPSAPWPKGARPVRIARSALAPNVPHTDLYVTQAHALLIDRVLIAAGCLINGTTITLDDARSSDELELFHIKLEKHDVIYVEGAPVETLLEVDEGAVNFAEYFRRYGAPTGGEVPCLPVLSDFRRGNGLGVRVRSAVTWADRRRQIRAMRDRLAQRGLALSREPELSI